MQVSKETQSKGSILSGTRASNALCNVTCRGLCVTYRRVLDWVIGFIDTLYIHDSGLQAITALSLIYTLYSSPLHTH
jgi:hypothetical protein